MLSLIGIIGIVIFAIQVYRSANDTQRNAGLWTILTIGVGIGFQFILPFIVGLVIAIVMIVGGTAPEDVSLESFGLAMFLGVVTLALSFVGMFLILKHVSSIRDDPPTVFGPEPPPPPTF